MADRVGLDIGKSSLKYCGNRGAGEVELGEIPSYRSRGKLTNVIIGGSNTQSISVKYKGVDWILGEGAPLGTNFSWPTDEKKGNEQNLILILAALARLGVSDADVIVGLPVTTAEHKKEVESVKATFNGAHLAVINGATREFNIRTNVLPEPLGTYFSLVLDKGFKPITTSPYFHDLMAVIDIGYRTVDIVTLKGGKLAEVKKSTLSGTVTLFEKVWKDLSNDYGMLKDNETVKVYDHICNHVGANDGLRIKGEEVGERFWEKVAGYKAQLARDIYNEMKSILSSTDPDRMLITGGGAILLRNELLSIDKKLTFHENPRFANALGFYRAAEARALATLA